MDKNSYLRSELIVSENDEHILIYFKNYSGELIYCIEQSSYETASSIIDMIAKDRETSVGFIACMVHKVHRVLPND